MKTKINREDLLREAMPWFHRQGVKDLTEAKIRKEHTLSSEEFASYFIDKEDFLRQAVELYLQDQKRAQLMLLDQDSKPVKQLLNIIRHQTLQLQPVQPSFYVQLQYLYPRVWNLYLQFTQTHSYYMFYDLLNRGIQQRSFRPDLNIEVVTKVILEEINILLNQCLFPSHRYNLAEVFRGIFQYYLKGISTDTGCKEIDGAFVNFEL